MKYNNLLMIILAFVFGYFLQGMMKNMCGGQIVEYSKPTTTPVSKLKPNEHLCPLATKINGSSLSGTSGDCKKVFDPSSSDDIISVRDAGLAGIYIYDRDGTMSSGCIVETKNCDPCNPRRIVRGSDPHGFYTSECEGIDDYQASIVNYKIGGNILNNEHKATDEELREDAYY